MNNKTGRPRNTSGSLYSRRDSRVWWMSYRDHRRKVQTGVDRPKGERRSREGDAQAVGGSGRGAAAERLTGRWDQLSTSGRTGSLRTALSRPSGASRPIGTTSAR